MTALVIIRARPGCDATADSARTLGLDARCFPMFTVEAIDWHAPDPEDFDGVLLGSANALRYGGASLDRYQALPCHVVGETTAEAARAAGFNVVTTGVGSLQKVLEGLPEDQRRLLRLSGAENVELIPRADQTITQRIVYRAVPEPMPAELVPLLAEPTTVMLHSASAARHFADECHRQGVDRRNISIAAIGPRVADAAGLGWADVQSAEKPTDFATLALAQRMCQDKPQSETDKTGRMQDEKVTPAQHMPPPLPKPRRGASLRWMLGGTVLAFLLGGGLVGWLAWDGKLAPYLPEQTAQSTVSTPTQPNTPAETPPLIIPPQVKQDEAVTSVEGRLAMLEDRLSRIDTQANAASGNAARAEGLLIAFAARRAIDRGAPLGYIEQQLRLRFSDAQPNAVRTVVEASKSPITLDELSSELDAQTGLLTQNAENEGTWTRLNRELSNLFVLRSESTPSVDPKNRLARARALLLSGKVDAAIAEVERLPGANNAATWIANARRYSDAHRALDLIETTAMLEPSRLQDGSGEAVNQPSPLAPPAEAASEAAQ